MSDIAKIKLCILWESELRQAAKLVKIAVDADSDDKEERVQKLVNALLAAHVALAGLSDDTVVVMVGSDEIRKKRINQKSAK